MVERACCESDAVKVVCGISYEIAVRILYQAGLHGSNRKEGFAIDQAAPALIETRSAAGTRPGSGKRLSRHRSRPYVRIPTFSNFYFDTLARIMDIELSYKIVSVAELPGMLNHHYLWCSVSIILIRTRRSRLACRLESS